MSEVWVYNRDGSRNKLLTNYNHILLVNEINNFPRISKNTWRQKNNYKINPELRDQQQK